MLHETPSLRRTQVSCSAASFSSALPNVATIPCRFSLPLHLSSSPCSQFATGEASRPSQALGAPPSTTPAYLVAARICTSRSTVVGIESGTQHIPSGYVLTRWAHMPTPYLPPHWRCTPVHVVSSIQCWWRKACWSPASRSAVSFPSTIVWPQPFAACRIRRHFSLPSQSPRPHSRSSPK